jgi:hypothetical protein
MIARLLATVAVGLVVFAAPAQAAVSVKAAAMADSVEVTVKGAKAKAVTVVAGGKTRKLASEGNSKWISKPISRLSAQIGRSVTVKVRTANGTQSFTVTLQRGTPGPDTRMPDEG